MAAQIRILLLALLLALPACHKTHVPPDYRSSSSHSSSYSTYTVRKGDTLYSIGRRFGVDHKLLASRNRIGWPYTIFVGQQLYLTRPAPTPEYMPVPKKATPPASVSSKPGKPEKSNATASRDYHAPAVNGSSKTVLRWPVDGTVTSGFGHRGSRMHDGIDIGAAEGTPVRAAASGEVVYSDQRLTGYGKLIIIRHDNDLFTAYGHNQRNLVNKGDRVKAGDIIARVGHTGRASGPHLHFEVRRGTTPVDPLAYLIRR